MANEEHLKILRQGVRVWNEWRGKNPEIKPDLSNANLSGAYLNNVNFSYTTLREADLRGISLIAANLSEADLSNADIRAARLRTAVISEAIISGALLNEADLSNADLAGAKLGGAELYGAKLTHANLREADLSNAYLVYTSFREANINGANLRSAELFDAEFIGSILNDADLSYAMMRSTVFGATDLSKVKGLDSIIHFGPSIISIDTIYQSRGNIPEAFLRGAGVPDNFIAYMHSLTGKAFEFYSCFISYSSKNQAFAERIYADLQSKGVHCWFAPEDMKIGDKFRQRIEEAIRLHDKLLVILSEDSISSTWVEEEVESALERERRENRIVLFPVRIDDAVMESNQAWAASLRRMRHIGDFSRWKEHDHYSKAFDRLLRDLKAESGAA